MRRLSRGNVQIHHSLEVTEALLKELRPDAVILAAGASPATPDIPGIGGPGVFDARDVLTGKTAIANPAVILGAGYVGMETADFLIAMGVAPTILEMQPFYPVGKLTAHGYFLHKRIKEGGGVVSSALRDPNRRRFRDLHPEQRREDAARDHGDHGHGPRPDNALETTLKGLGIEYRTVGDAKSPRRLLEAIHEGDQAVRTL